MRAAVKFARLDVGVGVERDHPLVDGACPPFEIVGRLRLEPGRIGGETQREQAGEDEGRDTRTTHR